MSSIRRGSGKSDSADSMLPKVMKVLGKFAKYAAIAIVVVGIMLVVDTAGAAQWNDAGSYVSEPAPTHDPIAVATEAHSKIVKDCLGVTGRVVDDKTMHYAAAIYSACMAKQYVTLKRAAEDKASDYELRIAGGGL